MSFGEFKEFPAIVLRSVRYGPGVPRLTPDQLQAARVQSGRLGGRPRKPTVDEARADALERLVPKAVRVLEEHLDSGRADAWRPALRVLEHQWGRPPDQITSEPVLEDGELDFDKMSTPQLVAFVREHPASVYAATESESADDSPAVSTLAVS